ncbi:MAG TPA: 1,2-phenylacetyl-CoA epoxidase subunit PaaC [Chitinophagaceae bacterium]|nr:1,2-phenylacetyl-CoA epoxidase subunit PaaC [Chitinophagaceae bacterium]
MEKSLFEYVIHLADDALILGHRNSEWCGHGPVLEQDIAITNISLDLIGQARNFFQYAAEIKGGDTTEDSLAYLRDVREFRNCLLVEQQNGDWAKTILRQFFMSNYQQLLYSRLQNSPDVQIAAICEKALKEVTYHLKWSSEWVIRLGDGTDESHTRMNKAIDELWTYTGELFIPAGYETKAFENGLTPELTTLKNDWLNRVAIVFEEAKLPVPPPGFSQTGGKQGVHTEYLGYILAEMQYLQRTYPASKW